MHPLPAHDRVVLLGPLVTAPNIAVGAYTYDDEPDGATGFARRNVLHAYGPERLVLGRYCAIAAGAALGLAPAMPTERGRPRATVRCRRFPSSTGPEGNRAARRPGTLGRIS